jgi:outer membrane receptor protein involved in Fe transport
MKTFLSAIVGTLLTLYGIEANADGAMGEGQVAIAIESKTLADALDQWAQQTGFQIIVPNWQLAKRLPAPTLKGSFSAKAALERLLAGTPLTWALLTERAVVIRERGPVVPQEREGAVGHDGAQPPVRLPQAEPNSKQSLATGGDTPESVHDPSSDLARSSRGTTGFEEVVIVTGTHIRGANESPSPTLIFQREDIVATGVATLREFFEKVPQNFGGGPNPANTLRTAQAGNDSLTVGFGAGLNIRGLGAGTTLTLVNGHRLAPSDSGAFVDVSMIPLTAIDRIEIMSDGASAIYGSDAVGGVVNIVLRDSYEGLETTMRYGAVTQGSYHELRLSQAAGGSWDGGRILATYEHLDQDTLASSAKDFSKDAPFPWDLIPSAKRDGLYGSVAQAIGERLEIVADAYYSRRTNDFSANAFGFPSREAARVEQYGGVVSGALQMTDAWQLQLSGSYSRDSIRNESEQEFGELTFSEERTNRTSGWYFDLVVDGPVARLPAGALRVAVGASRHQERYNSMVASTPLADFTARRHVDALFAEASVPVIGDRNTHPGIHSLALTIAVRRDRYSDFGSTTNPKFGAIWAPVPDVRLRATYGEAFRAPTFNELSSQSAAAGLAVFPDPAVPSGQTITLFANGGNPELGPETARMWTSGLEWRPGSLPEFTASVNYYHIDYKQRVATPLDDFTVVFFEEDALGTLIDRDPTSQEIDRFVNIGGFGFTIFTEGPFGVSPGVDESNAEAIADLRLHNLASTRQHGLDMQLGYSVKAGIGQLKFDLNANYILDSTKRLTDTSPEQPAFNVIYSPVDLRLRAGMSLERAALFAALYANHTDKYVNNTVSPSTSIGSWTTADGVLGYKFDRAGRSIFDNLKLQLSVQNIFDRAPPFVSNIRGTGFDPTNANPLGRFVAIDVSAAW